MGKTRCVSLGSLEKQNTCICPIMRERLIYYKELAHEIMEAKKIKIFSWQAKTKDNQCYGSSPSLKA
jgi:hypothetical protein